MTRDSHGHTRAKQLGGLCASSRRALAQVTLQQATASCRWSGGSERMLLDHATAAEAGVGAMDVGNRRRHGRGGGRAQRQGIQSAQVTPAAIWRIANPAARHPPPPPPGLCPAAASPRLALGGRRRRWPSRLAQTSAHSFSCAPSPAASGVGLPPPLPSPRARCGEGRSRTRAPRGRRGLLVLQAHPGQARLVLSRRPRLAGARM